MLCLDSISWQVQQSLIRECDKSTVYDECVYVAGPFVRHFIAKDVTHVFCIVHAFQTCGCWDILTLAT